eukprot:403369120
MKCRGVVFWQLVSKAVGRVKNLGFEDGESLRFTSLDNNTSLIHSGSFSNVLKDRKEKEAQIQMIMNRISLLRNENNKVSSKIRHQIKKSEDFTKIRQQQEEQLKLRMQTQYEIERAWEELRDKNLIKKEENREKILKKQFEDQQNLMLKVSSQKNLKVQHQKIISQNQTLQHQINKEAKIKVQCQEILSKNSVELYKQQKQENVKQMQQAKYYEEMEKIAQQERQIQKLIKIERDALEQLQNTQKLEKQSRIKFIESIRPISKLQQNMNLSESTTDLRTTSRISAKTFSNLHTNR